MATESDDLTVFQTVSQNLGKTRGWKLSGVQLDLGWFRLHYDPSRPFKKEYKMLGKLGEGSFGAVYMVRHRTLKQDRAMKMLDKRKEVKEDMAFVVTEIEAMVRLDHPNVSKFYKFYETTDHLYLISELLTEGDFSAMGPEWPEPTLQVLFQDVFRGVAYCHSEGIAHRDLKFENCLRTKGSDREIGKVIDFGLSAINADATELYMKESLGTKFFVAPEVIRKSSYGVKCDCWSIGIMLYIVLTGEFPFQANNESATTLPTEKLFERILHSKFRMRPLDRAHARPPAVQLLKALLKKNPTDRLDATTALEAKWLQVESSDTQVKGLKRRPTQVMLRRMQTFSHMSRFEKTVLMMAAHQSETAMMEEARVIFTNLDTHFHGTLTKDEVKAGFLQCNKRLSDQEVEQMFAAADVNHSGTISYHEWLSAVLAPRVLELDNAVRELFHFFDHDGSGNVSIDELKDVLGDEEGRHILEENDGDHDGNLDYGEFKNLIHKVAEHRQSLEADM